ncbi:MAG TPA: acyltransferase [Gammaproteobacteria bacterium]|nr:acyltransferase [Gammaproteobacteria bacterium]
MKPVIKNILFILSAIVISPLIIIYKVLSLVDKSDQPFASCSQLLSLLPGKTGNYLRASFYFFCMQGCKKDCVISFLSVFSQWATELESGVYIGSGCNIGSSHIMKNTLLGSGVHIMSGKKQHHINDLETPIKDQGGDYEKIVIGEDCWIGNGALVMADIGEHSIIGAGSVVVDKIPPFSIAVGNPAKVIQTRKPDAMA